MAASRLTPKEVSRYRRDGFIVPSYRVPAARLAGMRADLDRLIAENPKRRPEHLVLRWGGGTSARPTDAAFLNHARDPDILDLVEQLIGPDIVLWGSHVFCKPAGRGLEVPWHQDGKYWPIRPLASLTVWIALDPSTRENGCLRVIPGSHRGQSVYHHRLDERQGLAINQVIDDARFDEGQAVDVELEAGQLSIHDVYLLHGSRANRSANRRAGFASRYMPATSLYDRSTAFPGGSAGIKQNMALRPIYLVRGQDRSGNDFTIGQDRPFQVGDDG